MTNELMRRMAVTIGIMSCALFAACNSGGGDSGSSTESGEPTPGDLAVVEATQDDVTFSIAIPSNYVLADNDLIRLWRHDDLNAEIRVDVMSFPATSLTAARSSILGANDIVETLSEVEGEGSYQITATFTGWTGYHYWSGTPQLHCWVEWTTTDVPASDLEWAAGICGSMSN